MANTMTLLIFQLLSCSFMTGLIWTIQLLHYPAFSYVEEDRFRKFHAFHSRRITFIVLPMMVLELVTAVALVVQNPASAIFKVNGVILLLIWLSTFFVSVPLHNALSDTRSLEKIKRLVHTNWLRTFYWSARLALLVFIMFQSIEKSI